MLKSEVPVQTRYAETDQMGVIHHSQYLIWCEIGRTDLIEKFGFSYAQMEAEGLLSPVTEVNLSYKKAIRYPTVATVATWLESYTGIRATYGYEIKDESGDVCVDGTTTHVVVRKEDFRPVSIKKAAPDWHAVYKEQSRT
ncbi:acyl-CoA thioesterase [Geomicrobium sediminis]|uniref:Acyl-CoA thioester hydrolase n=1 Tax=Geomicrobium sediminis TaxID=1347788 RepID=A0ABS2PBP1_9BACL|nr:thioesterase family protein [Geomicrobium sediminis]MBM7632697.1 acyl-CoA thioester hydrolase [Geomicrobium sediminis]